MVLVAGHHEQRVGQAVEVGEHQFADRLLVTERDRLTLGTPADGARDVELGRARRATRQQEIGEWADHRVELVDRGLELLDVMRLDRGDAAAALVLLRPTQVGAEIEQLVLDACQLGRQAFREAQGEGDAEHGVEFVDGAVRPDAGRVLADPAPTAETGHPLVAGLRVDPVELWHATDGIGPVTRPRRGHPVATSHTPPTVALASARGGIESSSCVPRGHDLPDVHPGGVRGESLATATASGIWEKSGADPWLRPPLVAVGQEPAESRAKARSNAHAETDR